MYGIRGKCHSRATEFIPEIVTKLRDAVGFVDDDPSWGGAESSRDNLEPRVSVPNRPLFASFSSIEVNVLLLAIFSGYTQT